MRKKVFITVWKKEQMCAIVKIIWVTDAWAIYPKQVKVRDQQYRKRISLIAYSTTNKCSGFCVKLTLAECCKHSSMHCSLPVVNCSMYACKLDSNTHMLSQRWGSQSGKAGVQGNRVNTVFIRDSNTKWHHWPDYQRHTDTDINT